MSVQINRQKVYRGRAVQIPVFLIDSLGKPLPTCGLTDVEIRVENEDETFITKAPATVFSWGYGEKVWLYVFNFSDVETALFKPGLGQRIFLTISFADTELKFKFDEFLNVVDDYF